MNTQTFVPSRLFKFTQSFSMFTARCEVGERGLYLAPRWVAMDIETYKDLKEKAKRNGKGSNGGK